MQVLVFVFFILYVMVKSRKIVKLNELKFSEVDWRATFYLAAIRLGAASLVIVFFGIILDNTSPFSVERVLEVPLYLALFAFIAAVSAYLSKMNVPFVGLATFLGIFCVIGDPFLWLLSKWKPNFLPTQYFGIVNRTVVFVVKDSSLNL
jgi:hypothetical protein